MLARAGNAIQFNEHLAHDGPAVFEHACRMGLEGIVSKRLDSPYRKKTRSANPCGAKVRKTRDGRAVTASNTARFFAPLLADRGGGARRRPSIRGKQVETVQPTVLTVGLPCQGRRATVAALYPKINSLRCLCWIFPTAPVRLSVPIVDRRPAHIESTESNEKPRPISGAGLSCS